MKVNGVLFLKDLKSLYEHLQQKMPLLVLLKDRMWGEVKDM